MSLRCLPFVFVLLLGPASTASAQLPFDHHPKKDPYRGLFGNRAPTQNNSVPVPIAGREAPQKPVVVCGTMILPADPRIDPKMRIAPPSDGADHKLHTITPPICKPQ
jgi:hypothetical protein